MTLPRLANDCRLVKALALLGFAPTANAGPPPLAPPVLLELVTPLPLNPATGRALPRAPNALLRLNWAKASMAARSASRAARSAEI